MGSMSSSRGSNTSEVWGGQAPYLEGLYQQGADMFSGFQIDLNDDNTIDGE